MYKRALSLFLSLVMAMSLFATFTASAVDIPASGYVSYEIVATGNQFEPYVAIVEGGTPSADGHITIPASVDGYRVVALAYSAFMNRTDIKSVTIDAPITEITARAFCQCPNLAEINIPSTVTSIGHEAFLSCYALTEIELPSNLQSIDWQAFRNCTALKSINIPDSVTFIGDHAFSDCQNAESLTLGRNLVTIGEGAFFQCMKIPSAIIPDTVTSIGDSAFYSCWELETVTLPKNLTSIPGGIFVNCPINEITIPESVTYIGPGAFRWCHELTSLTIPDSVETIDYDAFNGCESIKSIALGNGVKTIGNNAFYYNKSLESIVIPDSVETIGDNAFFRCEKLESAIIGNSVKSIGLYAFQDCTTMTGLTFGTGLETIGYGAFRDCYKLENFVLPESLKTIGSDAFRNSVITHVSIPDSVIGIGSTAFGGCSALQSVHIGSGCEIIDDTAFSNCGSLAGIEVSENNPYFSSQDGVMFSKDKTVLEYYPSGSKNKSYVIPDTVQSIGGYAFAQTMFNLKSLTIPSSVKSIEDSSFYDCYMNNVNYCGSEDDWNNQTADWYTYYIDKAPRNYFYYVTVIKDGAELTRAFCPAGSALSELLLCGADELTFYSDAECETAIDTSTVINQNTTVYIKDGDILNVPLNDIESGKSVIMALYEGGRMVDVKCCTYDYKTTAFATTKDYTNAKAMVWESLTNLKPIKETIILK